MTTIRKFAYAALLAATSLNFAPTSASAQERAQGNFTLKHDVRWQNARVPAGDYHFSLNSDGVSGVLTLSKLSGARTGFLLMVHDTDDAKPADLSRLVLESSPDGSYVSAMQLPEIGLRLNFTVPPHTPEKQMAKAPVPTPTTLASR
jgi:hypothetical protein